MLFLLSPAKPPVQLDLVDTGTASPVGRAGNPYAFGRKAQK